MSTESSWGNISGENFRAVYDILARLEQLGSTLPVAMEKLFEGVSQDVFVCAEKILGNDDFWEGVPATIDMGRLYTREELRKSLESYVRSAQ